MSEYSWSILRLYLENMLRMFWEFFYHKNFTKSSWKTHIYSQDILGTLLEKGARHSLKYHVVFSGHFYVQVIGWVLLQSYAKFQSFLKLGNLSRISWGILKVSLGSEVSKNLSKKPQEYLEILSRDFWVQKLLRIYPEYLKKFEQSTVYS